MRITEYFAGYYVLIAAKHKIRALNYLNRRGIRYTVLCESGGAVTFKVLRKDVKNNPALLEMCDSASEKGFRKTLKKRLSRPGLFIGFIVFAVVLFISGLFVWDVELTTGGCEDAVRIMTVLEENGLKRGAMKAAIDKKKLENIIMLQCPDVSYAAVNMTGNAVSVVTDERVIKEPEDKSGPCDLVAKEDGYIIRYETYNGQAVCEAKTAVKRGDVLISGTVETKHHGTQSVHAKGRVYALVKRGYLVQTTAGYKEKYYTGAEYKKVDINLFSVDLTVKKDNFGENCDVFESEEQLSFCGFITLPVFVKTTIYREYAEVSMKRTDAQIRNELKRLSAEQFSIITENCEVQSSAETVYEKNGVWYLYCDVWCIADIASEAPVRPQTVQNGK